jgi:hypothetical protein
MTLLRAKLAGELARLEPDRKNITLTSEKGQAKLQKIFFGANIIGQSQAATGSTTSIIAGKEMQLE